MLNQCAEPAACCDCTMLVSVGPGYVCDVTKIELREIMKRFTASQSCSLSIITKTKTARVRYHVESLQAIGDCSC